MRITSRPCCLLGLLAFLVGGCEGTNNSREEDLVPAVDQTAPSDMRGDQPVGPAPESCEPASHRTAIADGLPSNRLSRLVATALESPWGAASAGCAQAPIIQCRQPSS